ncbi:MAG TPA: hypothetical protein VH639_28865 [Bryobacteraceae bacterium]|jgi:hypothetical protein
MKRSLNPTGQDTSDSVLYIMGGYGSLGLVFSVGFALFLSIRPVAALNDNEAVYITGGPFLTGGTTTVTGGIAGPQTYPASTTVVQVASGGAVTPVPGTIGAGLLPGGLVAVNGSLYVSSQGFTPTLSQFNRNGLVTTTSSAQYTGNNMGTDNAGFAGSIRNQTLAYSALTGALYESFGNDVGGVDLTTAVNAMDSTYTYPDSWASPSGMAVNSKGFVYVADDNTGAIFVIPPQGTANSAPTPSVLIINDTTNVAFGSPMGLAFDGSDNLYVADPGSNSIKMISPLGNMTTFVSGLNGPAGIAFDAEGNLFEVDSGSGSINQIAPDGTVSVFASGLTNPLWISIGPPLSASPTITGAIQCVNGEGHPVAVITPGQTVHLNWSVLFN